MPEVAVVLTSLLQADGISKARSAIVLREMLGYSDLLLCGISTRLYQQVGGFDEVISPSDSDFAASGLNSESLIRVGFIGVQPRSSIVGRIGTISSERRERLVEKLCDYLVR